jgi:hypothetical protein
MRDPTESYNVKLHSSQVVLGKVLLNRDQQLKHAFATTSEGIFVAAEVFTHSVVERLGIEPHDYLILERRAETRVH